ncbi:MAG: hypothetical protein IPJ03_17365 [Ignavibacteriales bacterium]|nr:hypothetical protein [Ignavibacteriales bacterium]
MEHNEITDLADDIDSYCEKNGLEVCTINTITILQERGMITNQLEPLVIQNIAYLKAMPLFSETRKDNGDILLRVPNGWVLTIHRLDQKQMNSVFIPE